MSKWREEIIGDCRLILGDCLEVLPSLEPVDHVFTDPPYSDLVHDTRGQRQDLRKDGGPELNKIEFESITLTQDEVAKQVCRINNGWFLVFSDILHSRLGAIQLSQQVEKVKVFLFGLNQIARLNSTVKNPQLLLNVLVYSGPEKDIRHGTAEVVEDCIFTIQTIRKEQESTRQKNQFP